MIRLPPISTCTDTLFPYTTPFRSPFGGRVEELAGYDEGAWWVQDLAASLPARLLGAGPGEAVLDLCAAPGGKTMQLAAAGADVTAVEINPKRLVRLRQNLERTDRKSTRLNSSH